MARQTWRPALFRVSLWRAAFFGDPWLANRYHPDAGHHLSFRQVAVANHLAMALKVHRFDTRGDLCLRLQRHSLCQKPLRSIPQHLGQRIAAPGIWTFPRFGPPVTHGA